MPRNEVSGGRFRLISGLTTGTVISSTKVHDANITQAELRINGDSLGGINVSVSNDGGSSYIPVGNKEAVTFASTGNRLKWKADFTDTSTNPYPTIDSLTVLFK